MCKAKLEVACYPESGRHTFANHDSGIEALVTHLREVTPTLVVLEATGGHQVQVAWALAAAQIPTAVVNPRQVRDFAKAAGKLAKTAATDAAVLAHFAQAVRPERRLLPKS